MAARHAARLHGVRRPAARLDPTGALGLEGGATNRPRPSAVEVPRVALRAALPASPTKVDTAGATPVRIRSGDEVPRAAPKEAGERGAGPMAGRKPVASPLRDVGPRPALLKRPPAASRRGGVLVASPSKPVAPAGPLLVRGPPNGIGATRPQAANAAPASAAIGLVPPHVGVGRRLRLAHAVGGLEGRPAEVLPSPTQGRTRAPRTADDGEPNATAGHHQIAAAATVVGNGARPLGDAVQDILQAVLTTVGA